MNVSTAQFFHEYARHRAAEGRALCCDDLRALPYLRGNPLARQWTVRARSFEALVKEIVEPLATRGSLDILDLGAGNGWLSYRLALAGHRATALDIRDDEIDGLGAIADLPANSGGQLHCVKASFDSLPFANRSFDLSVFNASLHYASELGSVLSEAFRVVRTGGMIAIVDSPFYASEDDGERMVAEKRAQAATCFGATADILTSQDFIEFLTPGRLEKTRGSLSWSRHRVLYPLWYEMRPLLAWLKRHRRPSRFDVWSARVS